MALDGERLNPVPSVGKQPSVVDGGGLQAIRLKRTELAILPPLQPSSSCNSSNLACRRRCTADEKSGVKPSSMAVKGPVIDHINIIEVLANSTSKKATAVEKIHQLERTIVFLQEKHQELLAGLHAEVKLLNDKNRDLVYKLTLKQEGWIDARPVTSYSLPEIRPGSASRSLLAQIKLLEAQLAEAQTRLGKVISRNQCLTNLLLDMKRSLKDEDLPASPGGRQGRFSHKTYSSTALREGTNLHSSLQAVDEATAAASSPTSLEEAESIIRALERKNEDYRLEIVRLHTELMTAMNETEKLAHQDQEIGRWTRAEVRTSTPGTAQHSHRGTYTSSRDRLPSIAASRQSSGCKLHLSKRN